MSNIKNNAASQETRRKLIEAACEVFSAKGYHAATTKEITARAGANIAAVNYHFRDKQELYIEVVRGVCEQSLRNFRAQKFTGKPEEQLRQFITAFAQTMLDPDKPAWHTRLFWREMIEPSPVFEEILDMTARPVNEGLRNILAQCLERDEQDPAVILLTNSIVSQCVFYLHHRPMLDKLYPGRKEIRDPKVVIPYLCKVCLAELKAVKRMMEMGGDC